jgi:hypothetical protein
MRARLHKVETRSEAEIPAVAVCFEGEKGGCEPLFFKPEALRDRLDNRRSVWSPAGVDTPVRAHFGRKLSDTFDRLDRFVFRDHTLLHEQMDEALAQHQSDLALGLRRLHAGSLLIRQIGDRTPSDHHYFGNLRPRSSFGNPVLFQLDEDDTYLSLNDLLNTLGENSPI